MGEFVEIQMTKHGALMIDDAVVVSGIECDVTDRELPWSEVDELVDFDAMDLSSTELGSAGAVYSGRGSNKGGIPYHRDTNRDFRPLRARGNRYAHGIFEQIWKESPQYLRSWANIEEGLITGDWWVEPHVFEDPQDQRIAEEQAEFVDAARCGLFGGWSAHLTESNYQLISGNAPFIEVYDPNTYALKKCAFRFPKLVQEWILDEMGQELVAVRFSDPFGGDYIVPAEHLLLFIFRKFGNDFEGNTPMRNIAMWVRAKQLFAGLQTGAGEKWGAGLVTLEKAAGVTVDETQIEAAINALDSLIAGDMAIIELPNGVTITLHSPQGQMPDFEGIMRYCDEQVQIVLKAEGSLLGLNGTGTFALAETKDREQVGSVGYYAKLICEVWNGANNTPYTGPIKKMIDARWGGAPGGKYPELKFAVQREAQDPEWVNKLAIAVSSNLVTWTEEDENQVRDRLKLKPRTTEEVEVEAGGQAGGDSVADSALNGAQISSMVNVISAYTRKELPKEAAIQILMRSFLMSREEAAAFFVGAEQNADGGEVDLV